MKNSLFGIWLFRTIALVLALPITYRSQADPPQPILELSFNVPGTDVPSMGSVTVSGTISTAPSTPSSMFGAPGSGVSSRLDDRALYNTDTLGATGGAVLFPAISEMGGLKSFTIQCWINHAGRLGYDGTLLDMKAFSGQRGYGLRAPNSQGSLMLRIVEDGAGHQFLSTGDYSGVNSWQFVAVTYQEWPQPSGQLLRQVNFFRGDLNESVQPVNQVVELARHPRPGSRVIGDAFGISSEGTLLLNPFNGLIDNFRFYGSQSDRTHALSQAVLEGLRQRDLGLPVPLTATQLGIASAASSVSIFWPTNANASVVQFRDGFGLGSFWQPLSGASQQESFGWRYVNGGVGADQRYYRLISP